MLNDILSVYQKEDKYLVLNSLVPTWIVTNLMGVLILKIYGENQSVTETFNEIIKHNKTISEDGIVRFLNEAKSVRLFDIDTTEKVHKPYHLSSLYLNMTQKCNLKCIYCFAATRKEYGDSQLLLEDYYRLLEEAKQIYPVLDIVFTGGEPLLSENTLPVARYAKKLGFTTRLLTNATLIDESNVNEISECFDHFKISMDGSTEEKHEFYRGQGSYSKTIHAINLLKKINKNILVAMVVTKENMDDVDAMNTKWGDMLTYQPLFPLGRAKHQQGGIALTGKEYYQALCSNKNIQPFSDIGNVIKAHIDMSSIKKCTIGDGELSISCTGDVYPCQLLHQEPFLLGNIKQKPLAEIYYCDKNKQYKFNTVDCIEGCKTCDFKYLCGGACQARHFSENGSIHEAGDFCEYEKQGIIDGLIDNCEMVRL